MTSVDSKNYGSIHTSDNSNERKKIGDNGYVSMSEDQEELYQELLPVQESWTTRHKQFIGISLALVSGGIFTANNFFINQFHVSVPDLLLVRTLMQMLIYSSICYYRDLSLLPGPSGQKMLILLQGAMSSLMVVTAVASVSYMPVPDALCIMFSCPVVTIILSAIVLKDRLSTGKVLAGLLLLCGVVLVCKPPFLFNSNSQKARMTVRKNHITTSESYNQDDEYSLYYVGFILALTSCISGGVNNVVVSKCRSVASPVLVNMSAVLGLAVSFAYCLGDSESLILSSRVTSMSWQQWGFFVGLSLSALLAFTTLIKSLQLVSPNLVASLRCSELVMAFGIQSLITMEAPSLLSCLGAVLINLGVIILAYHATFEKLEDKVIRFIKNIGSGRPSYEDMESGRLLGGDP